jgi:site-specific DNA recombinase
VNYAPHDIQVRSVTKSLELSRGSDTFDAEIRVLVASKSSRDTARRVSMARERRVREGKFEGGVRRFGFEDDGVTLRPAEAEELAKAIRAVISGVSLGSIKNDWRQRGILPVKGGKWHTNVLKNILLRPRNAGLILHQKKILQDIKAPGEAIVTEQEYRAVVKKIQGQSWASPGAAPRWLGSGVYLCICGATLEGQSSGSRKGVLPRYRCSDTKNPSWQDGHIGRRAAVLDEFVSELIVKWCCRDDAIDILMPEQLQPIDVNQLNARSVELRAELDEMAELKNQGLLTLRQVAIMSAKIKEELKEIDEELDRAVPDSPVVDLVRAGLGKKTLELKYKAVVEKWEDMELGMKRAIIKKLVRVQCLPVKRGPGFDPDGIRIEWLYGSESN